jgi:hypothetical protein
MFLLVSKEAWVRVPLCSILFPLSLREFLMYLDDVFEEVTRVNGRSLVCKINGRQYQKSSSGN